MILKLHLEIDGHTHVLARAQHAHDAVVVFCRHDDLRQDRRRVLLPRRDAPFKGRVERLFGTLQERLVVELRLAEASTLQQANQVLDSYLPRFNAQFAVEASQAGSASRPLQETLTAEELFCFKYRRTVAADNTISFAKQRLQLLPDAQRRSYAKARVQVHVHFDGHLSVHSAGRCLATTAAPFRFSQLPSRGLSSMRM